MSTLFKGEEVIFKIELQTSGQEFNEKEVVEKYIQGEVRIVTEQARYPLDQINSMLKEATGKTKLNYDLNPDYQRRRRWSNEKKSRLIESIIINIPIPAVFLYEYDYGRYEVMDGKQRLSAISDFYNDAFELSGLTEWKELNGKNYSSLPDKIKKAIDRRYISSVILLKETTSDPSTESKLKSLVFERLNSGGVEISPQEMRNALFRGKMNDMCLKLSRNEFLCEMWGISLDENEASENEMYRKMEDVELILRFFAFRQNLIDIGKINTYKEIFDFYLQQSNNFSDELILSLEKHFIETITLCYEIFGNTAFSFKKRKTNGEVISYRPGRVIYDPMMLALSELISVKKNLIERKIQITEGLSELFDENKTTFDGRNTGPVYIKKRKDIIINYIQNKLSQ